MFIDYTDILGRSLIRGIMRYSPGGVVEQGGEVAQAFNADHHQPLALRVR